MNWFSIASIGIFIFLILRVIHKISRNRMSRNRGILLVVIFLIHIAVIVYLGLD